MEYKDKKYTYLGGLVHGISTLATGMKTSIKAVSYTHLTLPTIA